MSHVHCAPLDRLIGDDEIAPVEQALRSVLGTGQFTAGPAVQCFESNLGRFLGVDHVVGTASGTDALIGALLAVGVEPGTEVIIPPNSFPGTENAVHMAGAIPVLADVGDDHLLDPCAVNAAITGRTRAVIPVHLYGRFADVRAIADVCAPYGVAVVEDAAQGVGLDNLGRWSHAAAVSFNPYKNLGACGKAGAVLTGRTEVADRARAFLYHGFALAGAGYRKYYKTGPYGLNARIDNIQAAALDARLPFLARNNLRRSVLAVRYLEALQPLAQKGLVVLPERVNNHVWHLFTVEVPAEQRDATRTEMERRGIETEIYYPVLTHRQPNSLSTALYADTELACAERHNAGLCQLPLYPAMTLSEQDLVINALYSAIDPH